MTALQAIKQKAKYGHRDWITWQTESGESVAARASLDSIRRMVRAVHKGRPAFLVHANCGTLSKVFPRFARIMLTNAKSGQLYQ